ncbi:MAG: 7-cyano-7-deazaguanine synthase [Acidobacteria bacterium]|nr:7-cyano-7-deazaguanine synthase [Acidobacteriota bacterium]
MPDTRRLAVVLLSGGLDSYTAAAVTARDGFDLCALTIRYGQRHARELESARAVARALNVAHRLELEVDLSKMGGSSLTAQIDVPKERPLDTAEIPLTYVPARNTIFLSLALEQLARLATKAGVEGRPLEVHTPLIALSKAEIIRLGDRLGLDYALTHSCYDPLSDGSPCRRCDSCRLREAGFAAAGLVDPLLVPERR